jgi:DnaJ-class molecular chaperone
MPVFNENGVYGDLFIHFNITDYPSHLTQQQKQSIQNILNTPTNNQKRSSIGSTIWSNIASKPLQNISKLLE